MHIVCFSTILLTNLKHVKVDEPYIKPQIAGTLSAVSWVTRGGNSTSDKNEKIINIYDKWIKMLLFHIVLTNEN